MGAEQSQKQLGLEETHVELPYWPLLSNNRFPHRGKEGEAMLAVPTWID